MLESVVFGLFPTYLSNRTLLWYLPQGNIYWHRMKLEYEDFGPIAADRLMQRVGTIYGFWDLAKQAVKRVTLNPASLFCSESILWAWADIINWPKDKPVPYPSQMHTDYFGVYQSEGEKIS